MLAGDSGFRNGQGLCIRTVCGIWQFLHGQCAWLRVRERNVFVFERLVYNLDTLRSKGLPFQ